jgi:hypothetical protein
MNCYRIKVSIIGIPKLYRLIEIGAASTFADLHEIIFAAFAREEPRLYSFFITRQDTRDIDAIVDAPEITSPENTDDLVLPGLSRTLANEATLASVDLAAGDVFHYLFDFGDSWWHHLRVEEVTSVPETEPFARVVDAAGLAPRQQLAQDPE